MQALNKPDLADKNAWKSRRSLRSANPTRAHYWCWSVSCTELMEQRHDTAMRRKEMAIREHRPDVFWEVNRMMIEERIVSERTNAHQCHKTVVTTTGVFLKIDHIGVFSFNPSGDRPRPTSLRLPARMIKE
jgi:hypothetical protein